MNPALRPLIQYAGKPGLEDFSLDELRQTANQFPFFGPAQVLLAKKLQQSGLPAYEKQVERTTLHFFNPLWLQQLLSDTMPGYRDQSIQQPLSPTVDLEPPATIDELVVQVNDEAEITEPPLEEEQGQEPMLKIPGLKIEPIDPATAELVFEPYHTVDYFASQGIAVGEEEKPKDRFSQQLRSFTDWLKTIKKVPVTELTGSVNNTDERKVEQMAEHSITDREVVTEAMAEVWEKQGDAAKALAIYRKLSLLDPAKSSYFAAKIEQLKHL